MSRRWLVVLSGVAHLAIAGGLWISGIWRIERLETPHQYLHGLGVMVPPPPGREPVAGKPPKPDAPKRPLIAKGPVQPHTRPPEDRAVKTGERDGEQSDSDSDTDVDIGPCPDCPPAAAEVKPVCGDGQVDPGEQCDDHNTVSGDGCSSTCRTEPKPVTTAIIPPTILQGLRTSGETQVHPSVTTQQMMIRDGATHVRAAIQVCIAVDGRISSATMRASTKYRDYDEALLSAVRGWRYRPYMANGAAVPACSMVNFVYTIH